MLIPSVSSCPRTASRAFLKPSVLRFVREQSRRLVRQLNRSHLSAEDVEQEILLDLWQRWNRFDAARSQERTFVRRVVRNKLVELARYHNRKKRGRGTRVLSLDRLLECNSGSHDEAAGHDDPFLDHPLADPNVKKRTELAVDMTAALSDLPEDLHELCKRLGKYSRREVRGQLGLTKHALQQEISKLREHFSAAGLHRHV